MKFMESINEKVEGSFIGKYFQLKERGSSFSTELAGASATFLTMAYILAVNPRILADSGGPCVPSDDGGIFGQDYEECLEQIKQQYVTATAIGSMVGCLLMGLVANLPIALAPGMGMNAYFTYSVVGWRGTGSVSYQAACTAVIIEGAIFFVLALSGLRYKIIRLIPEPVRIATPAGIGAFLAHLGLQTAEGIGAVVGDIATAVTLGGCPPESRTLMVAYDDACRDAGICVFSDNYTCDVEGGIMQSGRTWIGILGMMIIAVALGYKSKLAFIYGIALVTIISWFRGTGVTYFPDDAAGNARFDYFKKVVDVPGLNLIMTPFTSDLTGAAVAIITMLYVDFLDTSGTLLGIANSMGVIDEEGNFPKSTQAYSVDAISTMFGEIVYDEIFVRSCFDIISYKALFVFITTGSIFGLSPITSYIESGAGVEAGAKTGLTAVICAFYFFISIFFAPILASIPPWAIGGALIIVGALMARSLTKLNFNRPSHAISGFLTVMVMPLTYSIAYGLIAGIMTYCVMEVTFWILSFAGLEIPGDEEESVEKVAEGKVEGSEPSDDVEGDSSPAEADPVEETDEKA